MTTAELLHKHFIARQLFPRDLANIVLRAAGIKIVALAADVAEMMIHRYIENVHRCTSVIIGKYLFSSCSYNLKNDEDAVFSEYTIHISMDEHKYVYVLPQSYTVYSEKRIVDLGYETNEYLIPAGGINHINQVISDHDLKLVCTSVRACPVCAFGCELKIDGGDIIVVKN